MNLHHLGEQIDIHGGGNDLIFPHHENEIAQTESLTGKTFARYWIHNGMLQLSGEKMSKSVGNLVLIEDFLTQHSADAFRMTLLNAGYRGPLTYTDEVVGQSERGLARLRSALRPALPGARGAPQTALEGLDEQLKTTRSGFVESMDDDFNTSGALAQLFELVRVINQTRADGATHDQLKPAQESLADLAGVLGLRLEEAERESQAADPFIGLLIDLRRELRAQKNYALADQIRQNLTALGVQLEDSKEGTSWRWVKSD